MKIRPREALRKVLYVAAVSGLAALTAGVDANEPTGYWNCGAWGCGGNSPIVEGTAIVAPGSQPRPARRHQRRAVATQSVAVDENNATAHRPAPKAQVPKRKATETGLNRALLDSRFGEAGWFPRCCPAPEPMASACGLWGCGYNSPVVEGAAIVTPASHARPARRHHVAQMANNDVVLEEGSAVAGPTLVMDSSNVQSAVRDARFGEADTNTASSLKNGQQVPPSQSKILVMPLQEQRFGETWGKNLNSPVIEGAAIDMSAVRRHVVF